MISEDNSNPMVDPPVRSWKWLVWTIIGLVFFCLLAGIVIAIGVYFYLTPVRATPTEVRLDLFLTQTELAHQLANPAPTTEIPAPPSSTATLEPTASPSQEPTASPTTLRIDSPTPTNTLDPSDNWEACPGIYLSRLHVGETAFVSTDPPLPNRVRTQPSLNGSIIGFLQPGELIDIIEGPSCSNKWIWWRVHSQKTGMTGWTAEGDSDNYWLVPVK